MLVFCRKKAKKKNGKTASTHGSSGTGNAARERGEREDSGA
jgi:hypothetical protein